MPGLPDLGMFPANSNKLMVLSERTMKSEDKSWDRFLLRTLRLTCLHTLAEHFVKHPDLGDLSEKDRSYLLDLLPTTLPLEIRAMYIEEESYWKRCCKDIGYVVNVGFYGGSWKRAFLETHVRLCIHKFHPLVDDIVQLKEQLLICAPFVRTVRVEQLWHKQLVSPLNSFRRSYDDDEVDRDSVGPSPPGCQCLQFSVVLPILQHVDTVNIAYSVKQCGPEFAWHLVKMPPEDCQDLCTGLKLLPNLTSLSLCRSMIDDYVSIMLCKYLNEHPTITFFDLSHNKIRDLGMKEVGRLVASLKGLTEFRAANNEFGGDGAGYLAHHMVSHPSLVKIDLSMNKLTDSGGAKICQALFQHAKFEHISLGCCRVSAQTGEALKHVLMVSKSLLSLDVSNNALDPTIGGQMVAGLKENDSIEQLDVRMCQLGEEHEYEIQRKLMINKHRGESNFSAPCPYSEYMYRRQLRQDALDASKRQQQVSRSSAASLRTPTSSRTSATRKVSSLSASNANRHAPSMKEAIAKVTSKISNA